MSGALYPDDFPTEPVAGITDDEVDDFLASIGKGIPPGNDDERGELAKVLRDKADSPTTFTLNELEQFRRAADLLDGDR